MTADNLTTWTVMDGEGATKSASATNDRLGTLTPQVAVRTNGASVEQGNPFPTLDANSAASLAQQTAAATALGTPADAAADGDAASASLIGLIKRLLGKLPALGQATMAGSQPVVFASDQTALAISGNVGITGTATVTAAQLPASLGPQTSAASLSVTEASDSPVTTALGAPADAEAATGNGSLVAILKNLRTRLAGLLGVVPQMSAGGHLSAQTASSGTAYTAFSAQACKQFTVVNDTGIDLQVQQGGAGAALTVFAGTSFTFFGLTNADQLGVKRQDGATVQVTVTGRWES